MAKEALYVPEQYLKDVIEIIRLGMAAKKRLKKEIREGLEIWCDDEESYLKRLADNKDDAAK